MENVKTATVNHDAYTDEITKLVDIQNGLDEVIASKDDRNRLYNLAYYQNKIDTWQQAGIQSEVVANNVNALLVAINNTLATYKKSNKLDELLRERPKKPRSSKCRKGKYSDMTDCRLSSDKNKLLNMIQQLKKRSTFIIACSSIATTIFILEREYLRVRNMRYLELAVCMGLALTIQCCIIHIIKLVELLNDEHKLDKVNIGFIGHIRERIENESITDAKVAEWDKMDTVEVMLSEMLNHDDISTDTEKQLISLAKSINKMYLSTDKLKLKTLMSYIEVEKIYCEQHSLEF